MEVLTIQPDGELVALSPVAFVGREINHASLLVVHAINASTSQSPWVTAHHLGFTAQRVLLVEVIQIDVLCPITPLVHK